MTTLLAKPTGTVRAVGVQFRGERLILALSDGRNLALPYRQIPWLAWLARATKAQRESWAVEPGGFAIYWDKLDDGIEIGHLLTTDSLT